LIVAPTTSVGDARIDPRQLLEVPPGLSVQFLYAERVEGQLEAHVVVDGRLFQLRQPLRWRICLRRASLLYIVTLRAGFLPCRLMSLKYVTSFEAGFPDTSPFDRRDVSGIGASVAIAAEVQLSSVHAQVHNHFNQERHLVTRQVYKRSGTAALAEWRALAA